VGEASFEQGGKVRHEINLVFHVEHGTESKAPGTTPVRSLEPHIAFDWVTISGLARVDVRPRWLGDWIVNSWDQPMTSRSNRPAWVSVMTAP
jgi:hypothetical protein